jgi:hypothetical protein
MCPNHGPTRSHTPSRATPRPAADAECPTLSWADNEGTPASVQDVKVFGQLVYTFTSIPEVDGAIWNATYDKRDKLVKDVTANAATLFASAFPGTAVNCHADLSSAPTAVSNLTQTAGSNTFVDFSTSVPTAGAYIDPYLINNAVAVTPLEVHLKQHFSDA